MSHNKVLTKEEVEKSKQFLQSLINKDGKKNGKNDAN